MLSREREAQRKAVEFLLNETPIVVGLVISKHLDLFRTFFHFSANVLSTFEKKKNKKTETLPRYFYIFAFLQRRFGTLIRARTSVRRRRG